MTKTIGTLVPDILSVVEGNGGWDNTHSLFFSEQVYDLAKERYEVKREVRGGLRLSALGNPCPRELWQKANTPEKAAKLDANALGSFFYGDLVEAWVITLAMAAGHKVEGMQDQVEVMGIKGHMDCIIDGYLVDVKSASQFGFRKFASGNLKDDDPFGYVSQLSSYLYAVQADDRVKDKRHAAFLAVRKDRFELCLDMYDFSKEVEQKGAEIQAKKDLVAGPLKDLPRMEPVDQYPRNPNGNKILPTKCGYCGFKKECWPKTRAFAFSDGPKWFTHIEKEPRTQEIKDWKNS